MAMTNLVAMTPEMIESYFSQRWISDSRKNEALFHLMWEHVVNISHSQKITKILEKAQVEPDLFRIPVITFTALSDKERKALVRALQDRAYDTRENKNRDAISGVEWELKGPVIEAWLWSEDFVENAAGELVHVINSQRRRNWWARKLRERRRQRRLAEPPTIFDGFCFGPPKAQETIRRRV